MTCANVNTKVGFPLNYENIMILADDCRTKFVIWLIASLAINPPRKHTKYMYILRLVEVIAEALLFSV